MKIAQSLKISSRLADKLVHISCTASALGSLLAHRDASFLHGSFLTIHLINSSKHFVSIVSEQLSA